MKKDQAISELRRILRMRHYALSTVESYTGWVARFFDYLSQNRRIDPSPAARMEAFLSDLADQQRCSASTQN